MVIIEKVKEKYKPRKVSMIRLNNKYLGPSDLEQLFSDLEKRTKQTDVLLAYLQMVPVHSDPGLNEKGVVKSELLFNT